jgi:ribosomal-protein-alanine N-acetyltransferase
MLLGRRKVRIDTGRLVLRLPVHADFRHWSDLRRESRDYLMPWEPAWDPDHLSRKSFTNRVYWAQRSISNGSAIPLFLFRRDDNHLLGAITLDNIRRGPAQAGTIGYWTGQRFARQGYMREAITALVHYAFHRIDLSRIEAACLPENAPSRGLLESCGFKYEGVAQSYLQIDNRWRTHVLYAALRMDRRGRTDAGVNTSA